VRRTGTIGAVLLSVASLLAASAGTSAAAPPAARAVLTPVASAPTLAVGDDSAAARKAAMAKALAAAQDMYEGASAQVQAAAAKYTAATAELPSATQALAAANGSVIAAQTTLDQADIAVQRAQQAVGAANTKLSVADNEVTAERALMSSVITGVYQGTPLLGVNSLLTDGSPGEVLDRFGYANEVAAAQQKVLDGFLASRMDAKDAYNRTVAAARSAADARQAANTALLKAEQAKSIATHARTRVNALIVARGQALAEARKYKASMLARYDALAKENKQVVAQLAKRAKADAAAAKKARAATTNLKVVMRGYDEMPVDGWKSSNFGMRYDPIYKRWQLHAGVDIAAGGGAPIRAAHGGRVIRAGWDGGYGNYTCVDTGLFKGAGKYHGKEIANCYAHQSKILVRVGQKVARGQVIGRVGETGAATGYHLHFEVRVNGTPVQPLNWLPGCFC